MLSPQSQSGSFIYSVFVHVAIAVSVIMLLKIHSNSPAPVPIEKMIDMTYESFDRPPDPVPVDRHVARVVQQEIPAETKPIVDNSPKELQDDKSDIAGTQTAKQAQAAPIGSEGAGTAASTPYYKIKPKYPKAALVSGTEGWVMMKIDINEEGNVENVRVVDGEQRSMFQSEAKRAVEQWKYRPFVSPDGKPFKKSDHQVKVEFKLQDAG